MTGNPCWQAIPTKLSLEQFEEFVLPHLSRGRRGPRPTLSSHKIFNYILQLLYMGCQWKMLPIERNAKLLRWTCVGATEALRRSGRIATTWSRGRALLPRRSTPRAEVKMGSGQ